MAERRLVQAGGAEFYVELSDPGGPTTIRDERPLSFDGVRATVEGIATELTQAWQMAGQLRFSSRGRCAGPLWRWENGVAFVRDAGVSVMP